MNPVKRLVGIVMLLMGALGLSACLAGIYELETTRSAVADWNTAGFDFCQGLVNRGDSRLKELESTLSETKSALKTVAQRTGSLGNGEGPVHVPAVEIVTLLDDDVRQRLLRVRALVDQAAATADAVTHLLNVLKEDGLFSSENHFEKVFPVNQIEELSQTLQEISGIFQQAFETALSLREKPLSQHLISKLKSQIAQLILKFEKVQTLLSSFQAMLQEGRDQLVYYDEKAGEWLTLGVMLARLLLLWMGAGQFFLMYFGWKTLSARRNSGI